MPQDAAQIKEKILSFLRINGPSLPVHISQYAEQSILFTSAFLSELLSDKAVKTSVMRVGSSPIYFIPGQEPQLDKYSNYLKSKEKEAYILLKEKKFLKDSEQEPAIRVALREIKDFAIPFRTKNEEIVWRYFTASELDFSKTPEKEQEEKPHEENPKPTESEEESINIFDNEEEPKEIEEKKSETKPKKPAIKTPKRSISKKPAKKAEDSKFFNRVKDYLESQSTEILGIEEIAINKIIFKVKEQESTEEFLIIAYNKKRILEDDITKAYKKAEALNLDYRILCFGEPAKKIENFINASKALKSIEKIG